MHLPGVRRGRRGAQRQRHRVGARGPRVGVDRRPQVEGRLHVPQLLGGRADALRVVGGLQGRGQRLGQVVALAVVVGAFGRAVRAAVRPGEQPREPAVQPGPFPGEQIGVDRLPGQGVPERVRVPVAGDEQLPLHGLAQRRLQLLLGQPHGVPQQVMPHPPPGDRGGAQHLLRRLRQLLEADEQHVGKAAGHADRGRVRGRHQLLGVEGVALGAFDDAVHGGVRQRPVPQRADQPGDVGVRQGTQLEALHGGQPHQLGEQGTERMPAVQVVRPVRGEHRETVARGPAGRPVQHAPAEQEPQQVPGGLVGPVQVLQDQQQRRDVRQLGEQRGHALEEAQPRPVRRPPVVRAAAEQPVGHRVGGQHGGEPLVGGQRAEDLGERQIGQTDVAQVHAVPGEHGGPGRRGPAGDLVQGPGLAHPGVPGDEHRASLTGTGALQDAGEAGEFVLAADERAGE